MMPSMNDFELVQPAGILLWSEWGQQPNPSGTGEGAHTRRLKKCSWRRDRSHFHHAEAEFAAEALGIIDFPPALALPMRARCLGS